MKDKEITRLQAKIEKIEKEVAKLRAEKSEKPAAKKTAAKKTPAKRTTAKKTAEKPAEATEEK